jgi:ABC-type molybdate transport system permease subunit
MNINVTVIGQFVIGLAVFMAAICYYLGRRKSETPVLVSIIGFFTAVFPPLALVYLLILVFKRDLPTAQSHG